MVVVIAGAQGYAQHAQALVARYEAVVFAHKFAALPHLMPAAATQVLDIGAGRGADAAWFAARGHAVVAVEPVAPLRRAAMDLHRAPSTVRPVCGLSAAMTAGAYRLVGYFVARLR